MSMAFDAANLIALRAPGGIDNSRLPGVSQCLQILDHRQPFLFR
jgi:hypothetical protein